MEIERRISHQLAHYWQKIKGEQVMPAVSDIEPEDIEHMWPDCFLLTISAHHNTVSAVYDYVGDRVQPMLLRDAQQGEYLVSLPPQKLAAIYQEMSMTSLPIVEEVEAFPVGQRHIRFRQCLVPLGDNGRITSILGGMRYKYG